MEKTNKNKDALEQKRERDRKRRERIKNDPEVYRRFRESERARYQRRKQEKKALPITELPPQEQQIVRQRNREAFRAYYQRLRAKRLATINKEESEQEITLAHQSKQSLKENDPLTSSAALGTSRYILRSGHHNMGNPERLAVLCERVLKKYGLLPPEPLPPKGIVEPTDYSVIGGKPLRKRKEPVPEEPKERPITKRGRPKKEKEVKKKVDGRCRQRKYEVQHFTITSASDITITGLEPECVRIKTEEFDSPPDHRKNEEQHFTMSPASDITDTGLEPEYVRIKTEELDLPLEHDPLIEDDPEYLVGVKEETPDEENNEDQKPIVAGPSVPETNCLMPTLVPALKPGQPSTSKVNPATVPVMTVVLDDIQIFANSVAEQLRALPLNRALLLQLGIQNMLDAEKHFSYNA